MEKPIDLYIADNFEALAQLVKDDVVKGLKKIERLPSVAQRLLRELLQNQNDQERVYIIGQRYLKIMDHLFTNTQDKAFVEVRYGTEYRQTNKLILDVEAELKERYEEKAILKLQQLEYSSVSSRSEESEYIYLQPTEPIIEKFEAGFYDSEPIFPEPEIGPVEFFNALMKKENMLIVDTRSPYEFRDSQIVFEEGHIINIPTDIVAPGLSANTLGQRLDAESQKIWNKRDSFDVLVLMDWDTEHHNYSGSKLERLKHIVVEWDFNRKYRQEPVILVGGFKEFMEWYPSEVTNSQAYISQTNSDMDELLAIDELSYPETGSGTTNMNMKVHTVSSYGDIQARIARDFSDGDRGFGPPARTSRSEGQLPKDFYSSQKGKSPYRSLSEESLPRDRFSVQVVQPLPIPEPKSDDEEDSDDKSAQIKSTIEGDRAELLKEARALKPKPDTPRADPRDVIIRNLIQEHKDLFVPPEPPAVDRSFKPAQVQGRDAGYTGIQNLHNNCYISCMLQCLKVLPLIKAMFVTSDSYLRHIHREPALITLDFASVMRSLWEGSPRKHKSFCPQAFLEKIYELNRTYARGNHEDTFEFFIFLFNLLSEDCSFDLPRPRIMTESEKSWYSQLQGRSSYFIDTTYYQMRNTKVCWKCQRPNYVFDNDSTLMLAIPEKRERRNLPCMLQDYLHENLVPDYSCAICRSSCTIVNRKEISIDPEILIIVLKRYVFNWNGSFRKNEAEIDFPIDNLEFGNSYYKLFAIPQHSGTMSVGHYYASVLLNDIKDTWVLFNDEKITRHNCPINEVSGIKSGCVGFFYVRWAEKPNAQPYQEVKML